MSVSEYVFSSSLHYFTFALCIHLMDSILHNLNQLHIAVWTARFICFVVPPPLNEFKSAHESKIASIRKQNNTLFSNMTNKFYNTFIGNKIRRLFNVIFMPMSNNLENHSHAYSVTHALKTHNWMFLLAIHSDNEHYSLRALSDFLRKLHPIHIFHYQQLKKKCTIQHSLSHSMA